MPPSGAWAIFPLLFRRVCYLDGFEEVMAMLLYVSYDAYLLVCAMQSNSPLLTLDQPLKQVAESLGIKVLEV